MKCCFCGKKVKPMSSFCRGCGNCLAGQKLKIKTNLVSAFIWLLLPIFIYISKYINKVANLYSPWNYYEISYVALSVVMAGILLINKRSKFVCYIWGWLILDCIIFNFIFSYTTNTENTIIAVCAAIVSALILLMKPDRISKRTIYIIVYYVLIAIALVAILGILFVLHPINYYFNVGTVFVFEEVFVFAFCILGMFSFGLWYAYPNGSVMAKRGDI